MRIDKCEPSARSQVLSRERFKQARLANSRLADVEVSEPVMPKEFERPQRSTTCRSAKEHAPVPSSHDQRLAANFSAARRHIVTFHSNEPA